MKYSELSNKTKNVICRLMGIIPDKTYLRLLYRIKTGRVLHLDDPRTYSEKINWMKVYDRNPLYTQLADKLEVRDYVKKRVGEEYLFPLLGVWNSFEEIDFDKLPERFVLKCTHDFGSVVIVNDKDTIDISEIKKRINGELKFNFYYRGREWAYKDIKPRIIAEKNMQEGETRLVDYKFFCFGGRVKYIFVAQGRDVDLRFDFFDRDYNHLDIVNCYPNADTVPDKPKCIDEMIEVAEKLSSGINNVRVDLYEIAGRVYFSEMTFYHKGGMGAFEPYEADLMIGKDFLQIPYEKRRS